MNRRLMISGLIIIIAISWFFLPVQDKGTVESSEEVNFEPSKVLSANNESFARVFKPRTFVFPQDHGSHPEYRIEWWYFTGNVKTQIERKFGYELTFFRFALTPEQVKTDSVWRDNQMYMAHFALTDVENNKFYVDERTSRAGNSLAGASSKSLSCLAS